MSQNRQITLQLLAQSSTLYCESCGHNYFYERTLFRKVSRFVTGEPEDTVIPMNIFLCGKCDEVAKEIMPKDITQILFPDVPTA